MIVVCIAVSMCILSCNVWWKTEICYTCLCEVLHCSCVYVSRKCFKKISIQTRQLQIRLCLQRSGLKAKMLIQFMFLSRFNAFDILLWNCVVLCRLFQMTEWIYCCIVGVHPYPLGLWRRKSRGMRHSVNKYSFFCSWACWLIKNVKSSVMWRWRGYADIVGDLVGVCTGESLRSHGVILHFISNVFLLFADIFAGCDWAAN